MTAASPMMIRILAGISSALVAGVLLAGVAVGRSRAGIRMAAGMSVLLMLLLGFISMVGLPPEWVTLLVGLVSGLAVLWALFHVVSPQSGRTAAAGTEKKIS